MVHFKNVEFLQITMNNVLLLHLFYSLFHLFSFFIYFRFMRQRTSQVCISQSALMNKLCGGFRTKTSYMYYCVSLTPDPEPLAHIAVVELVSEDEMSEVESAAQSPPKWVSFCEAHGEKFDIVRCKLGALNLLEVFAKASILIAIIHTQNHI